MTFKDRNGDKHRLYPKSRKEPTIVILESTPKPIEVQLDSEIVISKNADDQENVGLLSDAKNYFVRDVKGIIKNIELRKEEQENRVKGADKATDKRLLVLIRQRDRNLKVLVDKLKLASFSDGEKVTVKTETKFRDNGTDGDFVEASPLTYLQGKYKGASPGSTKPDGWEFAQGLNKELGGIAYIRGHMLNDGLHGPNTKWNLKPISQRMNRAMDQQIENHTRRELRQKHKILFYRAEVIYYHKGSRNTTGNFPRVLRVTWGHLLKNGKFDPKGEKANVQTLRFEQSFPQQKSISINELGKDLLIKNLEPLGIPATFTKKVILKLRENKQSNRFNSFEEFENNYEQKIEGTKKEESNFSSIFDNVYDLNINGVLNFN